MSGWKQEQSWLAAHKAVLIAFAVGAALGFVLAHIK